MGNNFNLVPLTQLLETIVDNRGKSCPTAETGIPLIATNCIKHSSIYPTFEKIRYVSEETLRTRFRAELKPNDILFVNKGNPGRVCLVPDPINFCAAQDMVGLRVNDKVYFKYLFAVLRSDYIQKKISNNHVGLMIPHFRKSDMDELLIPVPDIDIQHKIGDTYFKISEKIELNNKINSELESIAKELYDYRFVQFDFPDENGKPYKSSGGKMVRNDELKREIPEGWNIGPLGEVCSFMNGINYDKNENGDKEYRIVNVRNITASSLLLDSNNFDNITLKSSQADKYIVDDGDILIARSGAPGATRLLYNCDGNTIFCGFIICCIPRDKRYRIYLTYCLKQLEGTSATKTGGSVLQNVSQDTLSNVLVIIPNKEIVEQFNKTILSIFNSIQNTIFENQQLISLRDFLLPMLMNGQVTVR